MLKVDVVTNIPTPNNAAFFGKLSRLVDLRVHFEAPVRALRSWVGTSDFLEGYESVTHGGTRVGRWGFWTPQVGRSLRRDADVLLLTGSYTSPTVAMQLLRPPNGTARIFWGERFMTTRVVNTFVRRRLLSRADALLAVGEHAAGQYRDVAEAPVHVLPYTTVANQVVHEGAPDRLGFVGQLIERKGLDLLFEVCSTLDLPAIDVVGSGALESKQRHDAAARGLDVTWHGERPNAAIDDIRSRWVCQVVPSRYDGWGVVVNEALASGTPVVVSSTTGAVELVRDGVNGWTHLGCDVPALASSLRRAQERWLDPDIRRAAAVTGDAFSAAAAATFLVEVLARPGIERSFIREQWQAAEECLRRGA